MTEKTKRKVNPRRRLLMRLILVFGVIVALVATGVYLLRPKGAQIVFIAYDNDGTSFANIWIADLNDTENPRQLTYHASGESMNYPVLTGNNGVIVYRVIEPVSSNLADTQFAIWTLNTTTEEYYRLRTCSLCDNILIHPDGRWIAYDTAIYDEHGSAGSRTSYVVVENLKTGEQREIMETGSNLVGYYPSPLLSWTGENGLLIVRYGTEQQPNTLFFYDIEQNTFVEIQEWDMAFNGTLFTDDGSRFAFSVEGLNGIRRLLWVSEINDLNNPNNLFNQIEELNSTLTLYTTNFFDWHPDNSTALISNVWQDENGEQVLNELILYNLVTGVHETLLSNDYGADYSSATFNYDGSQILYTTYNSDAYSPQLMLYDMETREEIALPLFGRNPQWVNGGRR